MAAVVASKQILSQPKKLEGRNHIVQFREVYTGCGGSHPIFVSLFALRTFIGV